ncbi:MAG: PfkB family carbohydrate kinase, partial [Planctomycetota bacterium]
MPSCVNVIGSLMVDRFVRVSRFPRAGETVAAQSVHIFPGGKGANQAVAAARCGATVRMCGRTGAEGRFIVDALQTAGVETAGIRTNDAVSGMAIVTITDSGENAIIVAREANARLERGDIEQF